MVNASQICARLNAEAQGKPQTPQPKPSPSFKTQDRFAFALREALKLHYQGRLPSLAKIARDYNLRGGETDHISTETARKWLTGSSIPRADRLLRLIQWLGDDFRNSLLPDKPSGHRHPNNVVSVPYSIGSSDRRAEVIELVLELPEEQCALIHRLLVVLLDPNVIQPITNSPTCCKQKLKPYRQQLAAAPNDHHFSISTTRKATTLSCRRKIRQ